MGITSFQVTLGEMCTQGEWK